jgi:hypothetical protein
MKDANLSQSFWPVMREAAVYLLNRSISKRNNEYCTPFELYFGYQPDLKNLRVIGSPCYANVDKQHRDALGDRAIKGIFIGYDERRRAYRVLPDGSTRYIVSRSVIFDESRMDKCSNKESFSDVEEETVCQHKDEAN